MTPERPHSLRVLLRSLALLPVCLVSLILFREALGLPILDDYNAILGFSLRWCAQPSLSGKLLLLISAQDNEYKLLFEHTLTALQLATLHHLNLTFLLTVGNLFLLPTAFVCWNCCFPAVTDRTTRLALCIPVSFLLFQLNYAETLDWSMASLQNLTVIAFSLLSIYLLASPTRGAFPLACISAAAACASSANGFLLAPVGLLMLLPRPRFPRITAWIATVSVALALYLYHYQRPPKVGSGSLLLKPLYLLSFTGSAFENMHGRPIRHLAIIAGLLFCLAFAHACVTGYRRDNPVVFFSLLWILLTAALVAGVRTELGVPQSLSVRYKIYCDLLLVFTYAYAAHRTAQSTLNPPGKRRLYAAATIAAVLFSLSSDILGYKFLARRRQQILTGMAQYLADPSRATPIINPNDPASTAISPEQEAARQTLSHALELGIYRLPPR